MIVSFWKIYVTYTAFVPLRSQTLVCDRYFLRSPFYVSCFVLNMIHTSRPTFFFTNVKKKANKVDEKIVTLLYIPI